jgi:hypothetical protein
MQQGNRWLKATLNQCAWAASRKKDSYFAAQHRRIASRRGVKRATMAVAHSQLCVCWELLKNGQAYQDLGPNYFEKLNEDRVKRHLVHRLEKLGYTACFRRRRPRRQSYFRSRHEGHEEKKEEVLLGFGL